MTKKMCPMMDDPCMRDTSGCVMGGFCHGDKTLEELNQWLDEKETFAKKTLMQRSREGRCWDCGSQNLKETNWGDGGQGFIRLVCEDCGHDQPTYKSMLAGDAEMWRLWASEE